MLAAVLSYFQLSRSFTATFLPRRKVIGVPMLRVPNSRFVVSLLLTISFTFLPARAVSQTGSGGDLPEVAERAKVDQELSDLHAKVDALTEEVNKLTKIATPQPATLEIVEAQKNELKARIDTLTEIRNTLQATVEIFGLLPSLSGNTAVTARNKLTDLRFQLAKLRAGGNLANSSAPSQPPGAGATPSGSQGSPPQDQPMKNDTSPKSPPAGGSLAGYILDNYTGAPLANAAVIAKCGVNGDAEYTTKTDSIGYYHFDAILEATCLVRGAKFLSAAEVELGQQILDEAAQAKKQADNKDKGSSKSAPSKTPTGLKSDSPNAKIIERVNATNMMDGPPLALRSYQERTIKNLTPSTTGYPTLVQDLRLTERKASIGEFARTIVGFEQSGSSSAPSVQKYFSDFWVSIPVPTPWRHDNFKRRVEDFNFGSPLRIWGDFRITSTPQQVSSSVGEFAIGFADQIGAVKVNQIAQATEFMIGGEYRVAHWGLTKSRLLSFDQSTRERFALYFTTGFGRITPLNPRDSLEVFKNPIPGTELDFDAEIAKQNLTTQIAGKQFLAFVPDDRYKFYKEHYTGFRLKTFYYDRDTDEPLRRFPATVEAVFGQNETVTGGRLHR